MKRNLLSFMAILCSFSMSAVNYTVFDIENAGEWGGDAEGWGQLVMFGDKSFKVTTVKGESTNTLIAPDNNRYAWRVYKNSQVNIEATGVSMKQITITYDDYNDNMYANEMTLSEGWTGSIDNAVYNLISAGLNKLNATATGGQVRIKQIIVSDQIGDTSVALIPDAQAAIDPFRFIIDGVNYRINEDDTTTVSITSLPNIFEDTLYIPREVEYQGNTFVVTGIDWGQNNQNIRASFSHAIIPNTIKKIGNYAFEGCTALSTLTIPNTVTSIGDDAFKGCLALKELIFEDGTEDLHLAYWYESGMLMHGMFWGIPLQSLYLGRNIKYSTIPLNVNENGYYYSDDLIAVTISDTVTSIPDYAFCGYHNLAAVSIGNSLVSIGSCAFAFCNKLNSINLPNSLAIIGEKAFYMCNLREVIIPDSVVSIKSETFGHLERLCIGKSVASIGKQAFRGADTIETYSYNISGIETSGLEKDDRVILKTKTDFSGIGSTNLTYFNQLVLNTDNKEYGLVTSPQNLGFTNCIFSEGDKYVVPLEGSNARISSNSQCILFRGEDMTGPAASEDGFSFSPSVFHKENVFNVYGNTENPSLTQTIHLDEAGSLFSKLDFNNIERIEVLTLSGDINGTDVKTINRMTSLKYLDITNANIVEGGAPYREDIKTVDNVIGERFFNDIGLEVLYLPNSVIQIDKEAFVGMPLKLVTIPAYITTIGNSAFLNCADITLLTIPNSILHVGDKAFSGCSGIKNIVIEDGKNELTLGSEPFSSCRFNSLYLGRDLSLKAHSLTNSPFIAIQSLTSVTISDAVTSICNGAFEQTGLKSIVIPESVTAIGEYAFASCGNLESIELPHSLKSLGKGALFGCPKLKHISIPAGINVIEDDVLGCCFGLTTASIEGDVKSIGMGAFYRCQSLNSLQIPQSVKSIGSSAFMGCNSLSSISIPEDIEIIKNQSFKDCSSLTSFSFPKKVTSIESEAFEGCVGLTSIHIPPSVITIGDKAFSGCSSLVDVNIPDSINSIGAYAFYNTALKEVLLPTSVKKIGDYAFAGNTGITKVISLNTTPPEIFTNTFDSEIKASVPLHVQKGSLMYYWLDPVWKEFKNMAEDVLCLKTIPDARYGDGEIDLSLYSPDGTALTYRSSNEDVVKINGSSMQIMGAGTATVETIAAPDESQVELVGKMRNIFVDKADLTLSVDEIVIEEGSPVPDFTYLAEGLQYDDTLDDIDILPQPIHSVDENSPIGEYAVSFTDGSDGNYRIATKPSKITVTTRSAVQGNSMNTGETDIEVYNLNGLLIYRGTRNGVTLGKGMYIVRQGNIARKITVK